MTGAVNRRGLHSPCCIKGLKSQKADKRLIERAVYTEQQRATIEGQHQKSSTRTKPDTEIQGLQKKSPTPPT
jgi:hypothetical protein